MRHSRISKKSSSNPWIESVNVALRSTHIRQIKMWFIHVDCPFKQSCDRYLFIFVTITTKVTWLWIGSPQKLMGKIGVAQCVHSRTTAQLSVLFSHHDIKKSGLHAHGAPSDPRASSVSSVFAVGNLFPLITIDLREDKVSGRDSLASLI